MPDERTRTPDLSRRRFLGASAKVGAAGLLAGAGCGPLAAALTGGRAMAAPWAEAEAVTEPLFTSPPAPPAGHRRFVTRPDLRPPGVTIETVAGYPFSTSQPKYIFAAPSAIAGEGLPPGAQRGLMIVDLKGNTVWFQPQTAADKPNFFGIQPYRGKPVLVWWEGTESGGFGAGGEYILADSSYQPIARFSASGLPSDLHECHLTDQGTALVTAYETGVVDSAGGTITVGHAQEIDVASNSLVWDWACYPAVPTSASYVRTTGDYFHINSIDLWPGSYRNVLISSRHTGAVYLIDRATKNIIWRLGGKVTKAPTFRLGGGVRFAYQHDARPLADGSGISLYDDASAPSPIAASSGKVINLDRTTMEATLRHRYFHTDGQLKIQRQGNCQLLPNGGHFIGWGGSPFFSEFRASGNAVTAEMILDGRFADGVASYRTFMFDWVGHPPQSELKVVAKATGGTGHFTAWVSWNGATEVDAWRLSAGPSSHALEVITTAKKRSFETPINFTRNGTKAVRIAALDAKGKVITRSSVVTPS